ncbi:alkane 1-monooxygenase [Litorimonas sp. WD9-15]|uniref:alkane 1-monooxygenase n=1 Tax=Litorimonas sp. WD9-15 TaxID=3418716 RepID=UPI003D02E4A3
MAFLDPKFAEYPARKRHLWLISLTYPLFPLLGTLVALATGQAAWVWLPVALVYLVIPVIETIVGDDHTDILGQMDAEAAMSPFYRYMVHGLLPIIYLTWGLGAWYVATQSPGILTLIGLGVSHGLGLGFAINSGHEVGHKTDRTSKWIALLMLAPSFYGHFRIEHNVGHHSHVATPKDSATSYFGESFWHFIGREIPGAWKRAWAIESKRADRKGYSRFSIKNEVVLATLLGLAVWTTMLMIFGLVVLPYMLIAWAFSVTGLSQQNYIAHYGLLRDQRPDGKYLPARPEHSWNCNKIVTNLLTFNLARHSDHHANPARHYQNLRTFPDAPQLPHGYGFMFLLAYCPPLFRRVMDPLVLANVDGDMDRVLTKDMML